MKWNEKQRPFRNWKGNFNFSYSMVKFAVEWKYGDGGGQFIFKLIKLKLNKEINQSIRKLFVVFT